MQVLIADDNKINRDFLGAALRALGLTVWEAADGTAAVELCRETAFDIALLDMRMPGMDGLSAAREIRRQGQQPGIRIVVISADPRPAELDDLDQHGVDQWLEKPISARQLAALTQGRNAASLAATYSVRETTALDWATGLRATGHNEALLRDMLGLLLGDLDEMLPSLRDAQGDVNARRALAHKLKGAARFCAAPMLEQACENLQRILTTSGGHDGYAEYDQAIETLESAAAALKSAVHGRQSRGS